MKNSISNFETICKKALESDNPQIVVRLYTNEKNKKNKEHNETIKGLLSLCQDEPLEVKAVTKKYAEISISKKYIEKILLEIEKVD